MKSTGAASSGTRARKLCPGAAPGANVLPRSAAAEDFDPLSDIAGRRGREDGRARCRGR